MGSDETDEGLGRDTPDRPSFVPPGVSPGTYGQPPAGGQQASPRPELLPGAPPMWGSGAQVKPPLPQDNPVSVGPPLPPAPAAPTPPRKRSRGLPWVVIAAIFALLLVSMRVLLAVSTVTPPTTPKPFPMPTFYPTPVTWPSPQPTVSTSPRSPGSHTATPTVAPSPQPPAGTYPREREKLTPNELKRFGGLHQGDCVADRPDDLSAGPVETVDCSLPHTDQVMGFVDLSEAMPDISNSMEFEVKVAQRCNSLKETLPLPDGFDQGVSATYPDPSDWDAGVRAALCWVPVFETTWVGSAVDGTARPT